MGKEQNGLFGLCGGRFSHDHIALGAHYGDMSNHEGRDIREHPLNVWPYFEDYLQFMPEDLRKTSYADFWRWWYILERYKGDEKGQEELERIVEQGLERGLKLKVVVGWSSWWSVDFDWESGAALSCCPRQADDWIHICSLMGRRFRGKVAIWDLIGESNNLEACWLGASPEHIYDICKAGYLAIKRVDPDAMVSGAGASPSAPAYSPEGNPAIDASLRSWYEATMKNCAGHYDNIPINFFADVADPYKGGLAFYDAIQGILDEIGDRTSEIGMGETSVQWAESAEAAASDNLNQEKQAYRLNEAYGRLLTRGMNKIITWVTEFAPGGGWWPWRWGLRNYEDWWGIWPDSHKVPGTRIIWRYDKKMEDGTTQTYDLRPEWARPADPEYPSGEVWDFWCQLAPAGSESIVLPHQAEGPKKGFFMHKAAYQQTRDEMVALAYAELKAPVSLAIDATRSGWGVGTAVEIMAENEEISFKTGIHTRRWSGSIKAKVRKGNTIEIRLPALRGFTALRLQRANPVFNAHFEGAVISAQVEIAQLIESHIVVRNTGRSTWPRGVRLCAWNHGMADAKPNPKYSFAVGEIVKTGESTAVRIQLPEQQTTGRANFALRLWSAREGWFGPMTTIVTQVIDLDCPRKLAAFRELGHVRLKWFAPERSLDIKSYEVMRADGFGLPMKKLVTVKGTEYVDSKLEKDRHYYYCVVAINSKGRRSRPSNEDNAEALSKPRIFDAEIVGHTVPARVRIGDEHSVTIRLRNAGTKTWDLSQPGKMRYWLQSTRLWGSVEEKILPGYTLGEGRGSVATGEDISVTFPFVGPKVGMFENHWILRFEVIHDPLKVGFRGPVKYAYFGTPLLVETRVEGK